MMMQCPICGQEAVVEHPTKGMGYSTGPEAEYTCAQGHQWIGPCSCHDWQRAPSKAPA